MLNDTENFSFTVYDIGCREKGLKLEINYTVSKTFEENNFVIAFAGYSLVMNYILTDKVAASVV